MHDSAIGKRKTRGVVRPLPVPVVSPATSLQRHRLVLPDDGLRRQESSVTTARRPTDDRGRNCLRVLRRGRSYNQIVENTSSPPPKKIVHQTGRRPERSRQHTKFNARIGTHSKPSRTPGNVSHTVLYDGILLPHRIACADFTCVRETRATYRKPLICEKTFYEG